MVGQAFRSLSQQVGWDIREMGEKEVAELLTRLAVDQDVAASTHYQDLSALHFL